MVSAKKTQDRKRGRYDLTRARDLGQRGEPARHAIAVRNVAPATVAVPDPKRSAHEPPDARIIATVNRKVDILEVEYGHGRISDAAYGEGRLAQMLFERAGLSSGGAAFAGSRVDAVVAKELAVIRRIDDARLITAMVEKLTDTLGVIDARIVREVLGENRTYAQASQTLLLKQAAARGGDHDWTPLGKNGWRKPARTEVAARRLTYIAQRFRDALETLARQRRG
jgi:hypothetical protein